MWEMKISKVLKEHKQIFILLALNLIAYIPSLFEPLSYGDECIYLTLGQAFNKGLIFYKDIHDNKPPMLYLLAALAQGKLFWFKIFAITNNLIHIGLIYELAQTVTKKKFSPIIATGIFSVLLFSFEGKTANGEIFMMMPVTLAVYLLLRHRQKTNLGFGLIIGLLFSLGFLFKIPVVFDFIGILVGLFVFKIKSIKDIFKTLKNRKFIGILTGFAIPILTSVIYYGLNGAFTPYVRSALMQNIGYLSSWEGTNYELYIRFLLVVVFTLLLYIYKKTNKQHLTLFGLWFVFGLFGALLSGRPYPHYLVEISPSLAILIGLTLDKIKINRIIVCLSAVILLIFSYQHYHFWYYPVIPYFQNFYKYATRQIDKKNYYSFWGNHISEIQKISELVQKTTKPDDRIFVWGEGSCIYALSERLPPGRYTVNYHIYDFDGFKETKEAIKKNPPRMIIKLDTKNQWGSLNKIILKNYYPFTSDSISSPIYMRSQK